MNRILHSPSTLKARPDAAAPDRKNQGSRGGLAPPSDPPAAPAGDRLAGDPSPAPVPSRCDEKGCVFPAAGPGKKKCLAHGRAESEPKHFGSFQPTMLLLDRAKFGLPGPDSEPDDSKARDRQRWVAEREAFLEEVP